MHTPISHWKPKRSMAKMGLWISIISCVSFTTLPSQDKLTRLYSLPWATHIKHLDLSGLGLTEVPCLSMYDVETLDLSHNNIRNLTLRNLPVALKKLDLSHNQITDTLVWNELYAPELKVLNLSHNRITALIPQFRNMDTLDLSYNNVLHYIENDRPINLERSRILVTDLSHNPRLSPTVLCKYPRNPPHTLRIIRTATPAAHRPLDYDSHRGQQIRLKYKLIDYFDHL